MAMEMLRKTADQSEMELPVTCKLVRSITGCSRFEFIIPEFIFEYLPCWLGLESANTVDRTIQQMLEVQKISQGSTRLMLGYIEQKASRSPTPQICSYTCMALTIAKDSCIGSLDARFQSVRWTQETSESISCATGPTIVL